MTQHSMNWFQARKRLESWNQFYDKSVMWNDDHSAANNVHSLTVNSEFINRSKVLSPTVSKLKKSELKRSHSWAASVNRIRRRKNQFNKTPKGM